jgi:hypothetical protein
MDVVETQYNASSSLFDPGRIIIHWQKETSADVGFRAGRLLILRRGASCLIGHIRFPLQVLSQVIVLY